MGWFDDPVGEIKKEAGKKGVKLPNPIEQTQNVVGSIGSGNYGQAVDNFLDPTGQLGAVTNPAGQIVKENQGSASYLDPTQVFRDDQREKDKQNRLKYEAELANQSAQRTAEGNKKLYDAMGQDISNLRAGKEGMIKGLLQPKIRVGRGAIAEKMMQLKSSFGAKGRLHSGAARKAAADSRAEGTANLASEEFNTREGVDDTISDLENLYQQAGLNVAGITQQSEFESQMTALAKKLKDMQASKEVGQGIGEVGGTIYANQGKK